MAMLIIIIIIIIIIITIAVLDHRTLYREVFEENAPEISLIQGVPGGMCETLGECSLC